MTIFNRHRKLKISIASTQAKSREPAYLQALNPSKSIDGLKIQESQAGRQAGRQLWWMVFRVETAREVGEEDEPAG